VHLNKDVSIIIPVYNAVNTLERCIDSLLNQTVDLGRIEIVLVDDGSSDESSGLCDEYEEKYPELFCVIHQENSGGPAGPRNKGIRIAKGEYVFFCDNDDYLGREALDRMIQHAYKWNSDVLLVKMGQTTRKRIPKTAFKETLPKADVYTSGIVTTLGPWKLFRRSLLLDNDIFFPEDASYDDVYFVLKAYFCAETISVAADYDYYFWTLQDDESNLSGAGGSENSNWRRIDAQLLGLDIALRMLDQYADPQKSGEIYKKVLGQTAYKTIMQLNDKSSDEKERSYIEAKQLLFPFCNELYMGKLAFSQKVRFACLVHTSHERFSRTAGSEDLQSFREFVMFKGSFQCPESISHSEVCKGCDQFVRTEKKKARKKKLKKNAVVNLALKLKKKIN